MKVQSRQSAHVQTFWIESVLAGMLLSWSQLRSGATVRRIPQGRQAVKRSDRTSRCNAYMRLTSALALHHASTNPGSPVDFVFKL